MQISRLSDGILFKVQNPDNVRKLKSVLEEAAKKIGVYHMRGFNSGYSDDEAHYRANSQIYKKMQNLVGLLGEVIDQQAKPEELFYMSRPTLKEIQDSFEAFQNDAIILKAPRKSGPDKYYEEAFDTGITDQRLAEIRASAKALYDAEVLEGIRAGAEQKRLLPEMQKKREMAL